MGGCTYEAVVSLSNEHITKSIDEEDDGQCANSSKTASKMNSFLTCLVFLLALMAASLQSQAKEVRVSLIRQPPSNQGPSLVTVHRNPAIESGLRGASAQMTDESIQVPVFFNGGFFGNFSLGTPGQSLTLLIQLAAGDTWGLRSGYRCDGTCTEHNTFDPSRSSTFTNFDRPFTSQFGSKRVMGTVVRDYVNVEDISVKQTFGLVDNLNGDWSRYPWDGMLALGWPALAKISPPPKHFVKQLYYQRSIDKPVFSLYAKNASEGSELILGGYDPDRYYCNLNWFPVTQESYWQIALDKVYVANRSNPAPVYYCTDNCFANFDSGSLGIYGPVDQVTALNTQLGGVYDPVTKLWQVDCDQRRFLPRFMIVFSGKKFGIDQEYYVYWLNERCYLLFIPIPYQATWFFGEIFLMAYYTAYDMQKPPRVGIAKAKRPQQQQQPPQQPQQQNPYY